MGGLDLSFGRYDTQAHQLADFHQLSKYCSIWPGQDYSNPRIKDFVEGTLFVIYNSLFLLCKICAHIYIIYNFFFIYYRKFPFKIIVTNWAKTLVDKKQIGRMPWHDIGIGFVSIAIIN